MEKNVLQPDLNQPPDPSNNPRGDSFYLAGPNVYALAGSL